MPVTILLADDEESLRETIQMFLEREGYRVIVVANGWECLSQLESKPDLILLDINMPKMGGLDALSVIRAHPLTTVTPIIVLSGAEDGEILVKASKQPGVSFMKKPFGPRDLNERIRPLIFRMDFAKLQKEILVQLKRPDPMLMNQKGLSSMGSESWDAYPVTHEGKKVCVLLPRKSSPSDFLVCSEAEATGQVFAFIDFGGDWKAVWPSVTPKP